MGYQKVKPSKDTTGGVVFEWIIKTDPQEKIHLTPPHHAKYGTFYIETRHGTVTPEMFGLPWYDGELTKDLDYRSLRKLLERGKIEEAVYEKLKENSRKTTEIFGMVQGA